MTDLDRAALHIRDELTNRIREAVNSNQECFIAHWFLQNPNADLSKVRLNHGFKGLRETTMNSGLVKMIQNISGWVNMDHLWETLNDLANLRRY